MMFRSLAVTSMLAMFVAACGGAKEAPPAVGVSSGSKRPVVPAKKLVRARPLVTLNGATLGPRLSRQGEALLMGYVSSAESELVAMPLLPDGSPSGTAKVLGRLAPETNAMVLAPLGATAPAGFVFLVRRPNERGETLESMAVRPDGSPLGTLTALASSQGRLLWFDAVPLGAGSLVLWAEDADNGDATLYALPLDSAGAAVGVPLRIAKRAVGWNVARGASGAGLSWVARESALASEGPLLLQRFDVSGKLEGEPVRVAAKTRARNDIEMGFAKGAYILGWTELGENPAAALIASVDEADGKLEPSRPLARRGRHSDLVRLISQPNVWQAAWHETQGTSTLQGRLLVGSPGENASVSLLYVSGKDPVYGAPLANGSAWLLSARPCAADQLTCNLPYEPQLHLVRGSDHAMVRLGSETGETLGVAWDLTCDTTQCLSLAASPGNPTTVFAVSASLESGNDKRQTAPQESNLPSVVVAESDGAAVGLAALALPAASGKTERPVGLVAALMETRANNRLTLQTFAVGREMEPPKSVTTLTESALLQGGVALAAGPKNEGAVVAWVAVDNGVSHVHLARVDADGKRRNHVLLTQAKSDKSSVAISRLEGKDAGYLVAWVDERDGQSSLYATRVTQDLARVARETKLGQSTGDLSELSMVAAGDDVLLSWVDTRDDPSHTRGDVYSMTVRPRDVTAVRAESVVLASASRSYAPVLARHGEKVVVTWLETGEVQTEVRLYQKELYPNASAEATHRKLPSTSPALGLVPRDGGRVAVLVAEGHALVLYDDVGGRELRRSGRLLEAIGSNTVPAATLAGHLLFGEGGREPALRAIVLP